MYCIGNTYKTLGGQPARVLHINKKGFIFCLIGDSIIELTPAGKVPRYMICNYVTEGPSCHDLTGEEWVPSQS